MAKIFYDFEELIEAFHPILMREKKVPNRKTSKSDAEFDSDDVADQNIPNWTHKVNTPGGVRYYAGDQFLGTVLHQNYIPPSDKKVAKGRRGGSFVSSADHTPEELLDAESAFKEAMKKAANSERKHLETLAEHFENWPLSPDANDSQVLARKTLIEQWEKLLNSGTADEKAKILRQLSYDRLILRNNNNSKVYINWEVLGVRFEDRKALCGNDGRIFSRYLGTIIADRNIEVPMLKQSAQKALSVAMGDAHEFGLAYELNKSDKTRKRDADKQYERLRKLGGDVDHMVESNQIAAKKIQNLIKQQYGPKVKIVRATAVGGTPAQKAKRLDPTDVIVELDTTDENGDPVVLKFSNKYYSDPYLINMKNVGVGGAMRLLFSGISPSLDLMAREFDEKREKSRAKHKWGRAAPEQDDEQNSEEKVAYKQEYLKNLAKFLNTVKNKENGGALIFEMWSRIHGCGQNVYTEVVNRRDLSVDVLEPGHYCKDQVRVDARGRKRYPEWNIQYVGSKLIVSIQGEKQHSLNLEVKTTEDGGAVLICWHSTPRPTKED